MFFTTGIHQRRTPRTPWTLVLLILLGCLLLPACSAPADRPADEQPGSPLPPEEPGTPIPPEAPGTPVPPEEPGTPIPPEEPGTPVPPEEPGTPIPPEEPGTPVPPEEPGTPLPPPDAGGKIELALALLVDGLSEPLGFETAGDDSGRFFIVEKGGLVRIVKNGRLLSEPLLDVSDRIETKGESGLLGIAFHPQFRTNRELFVHYSQAGTGYSVTERFTVSGNQVDQGSKVILTVPRQSSAGYHNGGQLAFGPDGYLYLALGDATRSETAQDLGTLLGALLRIDVAADTKPYSIPADNPFVGHAAARAEIWAYGLRNPWRFSFDLETGDLWIADVGQHSWEEVNFQPTASQGGENYGWNTMEGRHCFSPAAGCDRSNLTLPRIEYANQAADCSVTGGFVYRGAAIPALRGRYLLGDFCSGTIWTASLADNWELQPAFASNSSPVSISPSSFGQDDTGELYVVDYRGAVYRLIAAD